MSSNPALHPRQEEVLALIATGSSATSAARQAGVHRNTVNNWLKTEDFRAALARARYEKQLLYWDQAHEMMAEGLNNLRAMMHDRNATNNERLNATKALLQQLNLFMPQDSSLVFPEPAEPPVSLHKNAQEDEPAEPLPEPQPEPFQAPELAEPAAPAENPAPQPIPPASSPVSRQKIGRNQLCPCGSGIKYKRCCGNRPDLTAVPHP